MGQSYSIQALAIVFMFICRLGYSTPTGTGVIFEDAFALKESSAGTGGALAADFPEDASPATASDGAQPHKHHVSFQEPSGPDSQGSDDAGDAQAGADQSERRQAALDSVLNPQTAQWERYPEVAWQGPSSRTNSALLSRPMLLVTLLWGLQLKTS